MNKNIKSIFFVLTVIILLCAVGAVSAADDIDESYTSEVNTLSDTTNDVMTAEIKDTSDNKIVNTRNKQLKKDDQSPEANTGKSEVNVNNYDELIDAINNASNDTSISECTINLNEGSYTSDMNQITPTGTLNENITITINGNNQTLTGQQKTFNNKGLIIFNNINIGHYITINEANITFLNTNTSRLTINHNNTNLIINNSIIDGSLSFNRNTNNHNLIIIDSTINYGIDSVTNNSNITINNSTISSYSLSYGDNSNLNIINSTVGAVSGTNNNNFTSVNSTINGNIYFSGSKPNITVVNSTISSYITTNNYANITVINSVLNDYMFATSYGIIKVENSNTKSIRANNDLSLEIINTTCDDYISIGRNSNLTVNNSTIKGSESIRTYDRININIFNNSTIWGFQLQGNSINTTINDTNISSSSQIIFAGNTTLGNEVAFIGNSINIENRGTLTINGAVDFSNCPYLSITNRGILILEDNLILPNDTSLINNGNMIMNYTNIIYPFTDVYTQNSTLVNITIDKDIMNNGEMILNNVTINKTITNTGKLIISDDTIFTDTGRIKNKGEIVIDNSNRIEPYLISYPSPTIKTFEVNDFNELTTIINTAITDFEVSSENDSYIINMNNGTYQITSTIWFDSGEYSPNIIINANNQRLSSNNARNYIYFGNNCNVTINDADINLQLINYANLTLNNIVDNDTIYNYGDILTIDNSTISGTIYNIGTLIISEDSIFNPTLTNSGTIITNNSNILYPFYDTFESGTLKNITIDKDITINENFTLKNVTVDKTITNNGKLIIDDDVTFTENGQIIGVGEIVTNNITKILPYIQTINGNYTISNTTLDKAYNFIGNNSIENCNISSIDNINYGILNINNSNIIVEDESSWIINHGLLIINNSNTSGNITNYRELFIDNLPEDYVYDNTYHVINNETIIVYFDLNENTLTDLIKEGDTLDFQGTISNIPLPSLVINKPVNIITSTNDGRIEEFNNITYNNGASGSNVTGIYTYNTQFFVKNAHNIVFDNISNVVISRAIGEGKGQTSIRENSTNITIKNSYIYTKENGGRSSFVFAWADNCTLVNSTIEADGRVGNLIYLTTYGVGVPEGIIPNSNNQILNNIIIGPEEGSVICWGIVLAGVNNTIANNRIYYNGLGIVAQWGSGISGEGIEDNETSLVLIENNTISNNTHILHKPQNELIIDNTNFIAGETTTIQASIRFTNQIQSNINTGKITFKVNGKTLKDANGKVIYAKVINGTATIENYTVPQDWAKEGTTIEAVYSGSTQCEKLSSEKTNITIQKAVPTLTTESINTTAGSTITLTATITDNDKTINSGKIVFKINGKTVKDANGKVIYAKVVNNTVSVDYTIPESMKAGNYTITATYVGSGYDKLEAETTLTVAN